MRRLSPPQLTFADQRPPNATSGQFNRPVGQCSIHLDARLIMWLLASASNQGRQTQDSFYYTIWQFHVMPFGLQGAPATFQRMMDVILDDVGEFAAAYLDDIVIHSTSWDDHVRHLRKILRRLRQAGLTVKPKKCQIAMTQCTYLGHVVGNGEVRPEQSKAKQ